MISRQGRPTADVVKEVVEQAMADFPWPKSMRWGSQAVRWVRPLQGILCLFDGQVVPVAFGPMTADDRTRGPSLPGARRLRRHRISPTMPPSSPPPR